MFTVAIFVIAKNWKLSVHQKENGKQTMAYSYEILPTNKKHNETLLQAATWMNCKTLF